MTACLLTVPCTYIELLSSLISELREGLKGVTELTDFVFCHTALLAISVASVCEEALFRFPRPPLPY